MVSRTLFTPAPLQSGFRMFSGEQINAAIIADQTSAETNITAGAGGGLANGYQLIAIINRVTTVAAENDSVILPQAQPGTAITIDNDGVFTLAVYPNGTDTVEDLTLPTYVASGQDVTFLCPQAGKYYLLGGGTAVDGITAKANGNQATAVQLVAGINRISVCATNGDSVKLPPSAPGLQVVVINDGAATCQVYGFGTDTIDAVATATGVTLSNAKRAIFWCTLAGAWQSGGLSKTT